MTYLYPEKFTSLDGSTIVYTFPLNNFEAQEEQGLRTAFGQGIGGDYPHDYLGYSAAPKSMGTINIRTTIVSSSTANLETARSQAGSYCYRIGRGWLYRLSQDGSTRQRCLARLQSMPSLTRSGWQDVHQPIVFNFAKLSDWQATTATTGSVDFSTDPKTFTITNAGDLPLTDIVFRFRSDSTGPTVDLNLTNTTNNYAFATTRDLDHADKELKVDSGLGTVEYSDDDGSTYADDYDLFTYGVQDAFMRIEPGNNSMRAAVASGTPDVTLEYSFYARYF